MTWTEVLQGLAVFWGVLGGFAVFVAFAVWLCTHDTDTEVPWWCRTFGHTAFRKIRLVGCYGPYDHCGRCGTSLTGKADR